MVTAIRPNIDIPLLYPSCIADDIVNYPFPENFNLHRIEQFDGKQNPELWPSDYVTTVQLANGNAFHAIKYRTTMLQG
jgi:hypothetical protein